MSEYVVVSGGVVQDQSDVVVVDLDNLRDTTCSVQDCWDTIHRLTDVEPEVGVVSVMRDVLDIIEKKMNGV